LRPSRFDGAGTGHNDDLVTAHDDAVGESNGRSFRTKIAASEFVRRGDAVGILHATPDLKLLHIELRWRTDAGEDDLRCTRGAMNVETEFNHAFDDGLDVLLGSLLLHYDDHGVVVLVVQTCLSAN